MATHDAIAAEVATIVDDVSSQHALPITADRAVLLADRGMTSMAMVDLMLAVEAEFDITIPQPDLTPANFRSIEALARLIDRL